MDATARDLIVLEPVIHNNIWGGRRLASEFGYAIPDGPVGECWAISAHPHGDCTVKEGPGCGQTLSELWESRRDLFGDAEGDRFPLLVKIIDAEADVSIQVHPDDDYAKAHEDDPSGKRECWYILDAAPGTTVILGQRAKSADEFRSLMERGAWDELLNEIPLHAGDFFQIDPGTVHAVKAGTMLLETQQSSDITYRLYDYDRRDANGNLRELHVEKSLDVIDFSMEPPEKGLEADEELARAIEPTGATSLAGAESAAGVVCLERNEDYTVSLVQVLGLLTLPMDDPFWCVSVVEGEGSIAGRRVRKGEHLIVPGYVDSVRIEGTMRLVISHI